MQKTSLWLLFMTGYTIPSGFLLLFAQKVPFISFSPAEDPWVRFSGAIFVALGYFNVVLYRERPAPVMLAIIICHAVFASLILVLAPGGSSPLLYLLAALMLTGTIGSLISYHHERRSVLPGPHKRKPRARIWNFYVAVYTFLFGVTPIISPPFIKTLLGLEAPAGLWVILSGMGFLVLSTINWITYANQGPPAVMLGILNIRLWFVMIIITMIFMGYPLRLTVILAILLIGIIGTIWSYRSEPAQVTRTT